MPPVTWKVIRLKITAPADDNEVSSLRRKALIMQTGRNTTCPCGSGKKYKKCCLSRTYTKTGREDSIRSKLVQDLLQFFNRSYGHTLDDALLLFWDDFNPNEHLDDAILEIASQNFWEWVVHDFVVDEERDKTIIDLYMENKKGMSADEHSFLNMMKNSIISLYEVQDVFPEKGLLLKDLLLGEEYDVKEKTATRSLSKWDCYATRLLYIDGKYIMSGSVYPYPLKQKERILDDIHAEFEDYRAEFPEAAMDDFMKRESEIFNFYWYDLIRNPSMPVLHTTSGEPMVFSKAVFDIIDRKVVMNGLINIKDFEKEDNDFIWYAKRNKGSSATVIGRIEMKGNRLILECHSKKRLEKGKKLLIKALTDSLIHKNDIFQDPMEAMKDYKKKPREKPEEEIPMEIQQKLYRKFMDKHNKNWLKKKIPALNGKTPLQAVKTKEGRNKVIELLKSFENSEERNKKEGDPYYDLSWMWEQLGLDR